MAQEVPGLEDIGDPNYPEGSDVCPLRGPSSVDHIRCAMRISEFAAEAQPRLCSIIGATGRKPFWGPEQA